MIFAGCKKDILNTILGNRNLGTIHNHPNGVCHLGEYDYYSFGSSEDMVMGIICNKEDGIYFFTPSSLISSVDLNIY